jgi:CRISPR-associated protein Csy1
VSDALSVHQSSFRTAIEAFLKKRLDDKLDKLADDDPKREALTSQYRYSAWIDDAARRVAQIQSVTHALKPTHPDARGTNLYKPPDALPAHTEVGSHCLGANFADDVVGNAAALDIYKFLKIDVAGRSLLDWMLDGDAAIAAALSNDAAQAQAWIEAFSGITRPRSETMASHTRAKQLYWLSGDDPTEDSHYHLLAPLYSSSLAHAVYLTLNEDRFGDAAKAARQARRDSREHPTGYRDYPNLAVQKLGGTKPQNISQLNSERRGDNYLLGSLPPHWQSLTIKEPWLVESVFPRRYGRREEVRAEVAAMRTFLLSKPPTNVHTRNRIERHLNALIDALVAFALELQTGLTPGWSADTRCKLAESERLWLDPGRAGHDEEFHRRWQFMGWPDDIGARFGNWLNEVLGKEFAMGDAEQRVWRSELLLDESGVGWAQQLHLQRHHRAAPRHIPKRRPGP